MFICILQRDFIDYEFEIIIFILTWFLIQLFICDQLRCSLIQLNGKTHLSILSDN